MREGRAGQATPRAPGELAFETSTGYLVSRAGAFARHNWTGMLAERSLTVHHFGVLMTLDEVGTGQDQLSALIGVDPRNAVGIIDGLVERGLLAREVAPDDRRRRVIVLTTEGRAMAREVSRASAEVAVRAGRLS